MTVDKWWDEGGRRYIFEDPTWPIHDRIMGVQAAALTMVMNPTTLRRVYDNEFRVPAEEDAFTLPEIINGVTDAVWAELDLGSNGTYTDRQPMISSLRRNLQAEQLQRLIDLSMTDSGFGAAGRPIANLSTHKLRELDKKIANVLEESDGRIDAYSVSHLGEAQVLIKQALEAQYIRNLDDINVRLQLPALLRRAGRALTGRNIPAQHDDTGRPLRGGPFSGGTHSETATDVHAHRERLPGTHSEREGEVGSCPVWVFQRLPGATHSGRSESCVGTAVRSLRTGTPVVALRKSLITPSPLKSQDVPTWPHWASSARKSTMLTTPSEGSPQSHGHADSHSSGIPLALSSVTVPAAISHSSGMPLALQSPLVSSAMSWGSGTPLSLQS